MRLQIVSDLNIGSHASAPEVRPAPDIDALLVAGGVCRGLEKAFAWLRSRFPAPLPIVMVAGPLEFYGKEIGAEIELGRRLAPDYGIAYLEDAVAQVGPVRVLGSVFWTDYALNGAAERQSAMNFARAALPEFRETRWRPEPWRRFRPEDALGMHLTSRAFIGRELARRHAGPTVVLTHHSPLPTIESMLAGGGAPADSSDLAQLLTTDGPDIWIHGRVRRREEAQHGRTRLFSGLPRSVNDPYVARVIAV